jgi:uncharacterized protein (DUF2236 family)
MRRCGSTCQGYGDGTVNYGSLPVVIRFSPTSRQRRERTHAERLASRDGYFPPESVIRRIGNSALTPFLGGGAAVLLQVAHPLVAAGVVEHSDYRDDLWRRLVRTLRALYLITYGTKAEADQAGEAVRRGHARVRGVTTEALGPFPAGTPYSATDPGLMLWVHATLVHVSLQLYQRHVRRLQPAEEERYYREMAIVAQIFGTPAGVIPPSLREFREYLSAQIDAGPITVTTPARNVADVILAAPLPAPMRVLIPAHRLATAATLPPRLQEEYGLPWSPARRVAFHVAARAVRVTTTPVLAAASHLRLPPRLLSANG